MADPIDAILDFLKQNQFTQAEAALRRELSKYSESNGSNMVPLPEEIDSSNLMEEAKVGAIAVKHHGMGVEVSTSGEISKELIVKEVECRSVSKGFGMNCKPVSVVERNKACAFAGSSEKSAFLTQGSKNALGDSYLWNLNFGNGNNDSFLKDDATFANNFSKLQISGQSKSYDCPVFDKKNMTSPTVSEDNYRSEWDSMGEQRRSWVGSMSEPQIEVVCERNQMKDCNALDQASKPSTWSKDQSVDNPWSTSVGPLQSCSDPWEECSIRTVFPFPMADSSSSYGNIFSSGDNTKERKQKLDSNEHNIGGLDRLFLSATSQGFSEQRDSWSSSLPIISENRKEELPLLPPVNLKSEEKSISIHWEEKVDHHGSVRNTTNADNIFLIGSFLDVPVGQEINSSGLFIIQYKVFCLIIL